jgi:hypothetical protein
LARRSPPRRVAALAGDRWPILALIAARRCRSPLVRGGFDLPAVAVIPSWLAEGGGGAPTPSNA